MDKGHARVIIIGAGMAGLSAASHLYRAGFNDVIILEATDRIGGRIHTVQFGDSPYPIELGANWIHGCSKENSVFDVAESGGFLTPYRNLNRQSSMYLKEDGTEVDRNIVAKAWAIFRKVYLDAYRNEKTNLEAYMLPTVEKILSSTDPEIRHDMGCVFQSMLNYVRLHEGNELYNVAFKDIVPDVGGGDMHIPGGYKQVLDYIRRNIPGSAILFNTEVVTIKWNSNERGTVQLTTRDGRAFEANHVIITCAIGYLKAYKESLFDPVLPTPKNDAISSIGYGIINKVFMEFETPLMNHIHHGIVFAWENAHEKIDSSNWFKRFYAVDTVFTNPRLVTAWISGDGAIFMEDMKDQEVVQTLMKLIRKFMNDDTIPDPINYLITRWHKNPYSLGSYSHPASTTRNDYGDIAEPVKNQNGAPVLFFAGEGTQLAYFGCTHAARDSGIREAERIIKYCGTGGQTAVSKL